MDSAPGVLPFPNTKTYRLQIPAGEDPNQYQSLVFTLDCIAVLFRTNISEIGTRPLIVVIDQERKCPTCFRSAYVIFLTCRSSSWSQGAYQFAHELCHYSIPGEVSPPFRWLEESICQMASLFYLYELTSLWKKVDIPFRTADGQLYADCFTEYADEDAKECTSCDPRDPATLASLEADCYQREKNSYIANQLLPIFKSCPDMWKAVPLLCRVPYLSSLAASLDVWQFLTPQAAHPGFVALRQILVQ